MIILTNEIFFPCPPSFEAKPTIANWQVRNHMQKGIESRVCSMKHSDGFFHLAPTGNTGNGTNSNVFSYSDDAKNTYNRKVNAEFNNITLDVESGNLAPAPAPLPLTDRLIPQSGYSNPRRPGARED